MDLIQMAREIGKSIQASEEYKALDAAKTANDNDMQLQKDIEEFNLIRVQLSTAMQEDTRDEEKLTKLDGDLKQLYGKVMANENMLAFNDAKQGIDKIMNGITTILTASVNGEDPETCDAFPSSCGGSCSTCGGCH